MNIGDMKESKYLRKNDVEEPKLVTIRDLTEENLGMENQAPDMKWVLHFKECKPMVLNSTNAQLFAHALTGPEDRWAGTRQGGDLLRQT